MRVTPITTPFPFEHLAATSPVMRPETGDARWRLRLNFWSGRSLTAEAFELDQENRASRLTLLGRIATPGIVRGLEVALEAPEPEPAIPSPAGYFIHVLAGHGFLSDGEDVLIPRALRIPLSQIPVNYVRIGGPDHSAPEEGVPAGATAGQPQDAGSFDFAVDQFPAGRVPWAAVLLACPSELRRFARLEANDPCELDASQDAFADERRLDSGIFRLCELPHAWQALPQLGNPTDPRFRNRLAHLIFTTEASGSERHQLRRLQDRPEGRRWDTVLRSADVLPWELLGVPVALLSTETGTDGVARFFLDRASVARPGGLARSRTRPALRLATGDSVDTLNPKGAGTPFHWRARVDQFMEHLSRFDARQESGRPDIAAAFQFAPPVGFLPREMLDLLSTMEALAIPQRPGQPPDRAGIHHFFPGNYAVDAAPIAIEDLDAALAASAALAPYDMASGVSEGARLLVPVPQRLFHPSLLVVETEDPIFAETVGNFVATRQGWRQRRDFVRDQRDQMQGLLGGAASVAATSEDPGQLEPEPVEDLPGTAQALLSPAAATPPQEIRVDFDGHPMSPSRPLFLRLRIDEDQAPGDIEVRWRIGTDEFINIFAEQPSAPLEAFDEAGAPVATPLWRRFEVSPSQFGAASGNVTGFSLRFDAGRIAIQQAGQIIPGERAGETSEDIWWTAGDDDGSVRFTNGEWIDIQGDQLEAPFEEDYVPDLPDERIQAVEENLNPTGVTPRSPVMTIASNGLDTVLATLETEASEADDFVDANFTRAQVNLYRIRKLVLGENAAQQLLINPAIAQIAEQETANASAKTLDQFLKEAKLKPTLKGAVNQALGVPEAAPHAAPAGAPPAGELKTLLFTDGFSADAFIRTRDAQPLQTLKSVRSPLDAKLGTLKDVFGQLPETGPTLPPRGLSIGERFKEPEASKNLGYARAALRTVLDALPFLKLTLTGQTVRAVDGKSEVSLLELQGRKPGAGAETSESLRLKAVEKLLAVQRLEADTDEAEVTLAALDFTEVKSAILRTIERVITIRRNILAQGLEAAQEFRIQLNAASTRILAIEGKLAEARHDVGVARALRQEEQARVAEVNEGRDRILREEVKFLAYVRPRAVDIVRRRSPYWKIESSETPATLPACLKRHDQAPDELNTYIQLFLHSPARWFVAFEKLLLQLDTPDKMIALLDAARVSAISLTTLAVPNSIRIATQAVQFTVLGAQQTVQKIRKDSTLLQIGDKRDLRWKDFHREAEKHAAVGDLISGKHGSAEVSKAASAELAQIGQVATCLHAEFAALAPAVRVSWIERFSQFDKPANLRDLTVLPNFGKLERHTRTRLQEFANWLFGRVKPAERDAVALINDLIRLCLLLASHAPVNRIISGHIPRPTPVRPGIRIPIRPLNPELVRVGMEFHVWRASQLVARGRVEDLQQAEATAIVDHVETHVTTLDSTMRVQFVPAALSFMK